jgi:hypothetical protein
MPSRSVGPAACFGERPDPPPSGRSQLGLPPVLFLDRPGRPQTERAQSLRIRRHLGIRDFDRHVAADLRDWLRPGAIEGRTANELMARAEDRLREWRVMLPASSTLERLVTAEVTQSDANADGRGCGENRAERFDMPATCY